jgi:hypothetical protein
LIIHGVPNSEISCPVYVGALGGKWDSVRHFMVEKGIPFLGLFKMMGKED